MMEVGLQPKEQSRVTAAIAQARERPHTAIETHVPSIGAIYADENGSIYCALDGREIVHVSFLYPETAYQSCELDTSGGGSPFVKLGDKAKHEPEWLPVDWGGDSPFGDGDLKEPPVGVIYVDTE